MNYKRKNSTPRKAGKRCDTKSYRMAEKQALLGGSLRNPRTCNWHAPMPPLPVEDRESMGRKLGGSKKRPPKKKHEGPKCRHEWYDEIVTEIRYEIRCGNPNCPDRGYFRERWHTYCEPNKHYQPATMWRVKVPYTVTFEQRTCINCWEARTYNEVDSRRSKRVGQWGRRLSFKKRPVQGLYEG